MSWSVLPGIVLIGVGCVWLVRSRSVRGGTLDLPGTWPRYAWLGVMFVLFGAFVIVSSAGPGPWTAAIALVSLIVASKVFIEFRAWSKNH